MTFVVTMLFSLMVLVSLWYDRLLHLQGIQDTPLAFIKNPFFFSLSPVVSLIYII